jgi:hypothetical protein
MSKIAKMPCFSYYLLCFFFYKMGEQEGEQILPLRGGGFGTGRRREVAEKGVGG